MTMMEEMMVVINHQFVRIPTGITWWTWTALLFYMAGEWL